MHETSFYSLDGPLDSMPVERQLRSANLSGFMDLARRYGAEPRGILERHGIDPRMLRDPDTFIDAKALADLLEDCSVALNDPLFGLHLAEVQEPDVFGCVTALCRAAPTLRQSLRSFVDFIPVVHCPAASLELAEGEKVSEIRWHVGADVGRNDQANYKATLLTLKLLRQVGGRTFDPMYVSLAIDAKRGIPDALTEHLGCSFRRGSVANVIALPTVALDHPTPTANRLVFRLVGGYLERVKASARKTLALRVEDYIRGALATGTCSLEHCAKRLGISTRSLQVNLTENRVSFSGLLEEQRAKLAQDHLRNVEMDLDQIAFALGYADQSSFGRAFKRWAGVTPLVYRQTHAMVKP